MLLEDSYWQLFTEPEELKLINYDHISKIEFPIPPEDGSPLNIWFSLGSKVNIEGRTVTSLPALFGEIVGLRDFFNFIVVLFIGSSQAKFFKYDMMCSAASMCPLLGMTKNDDNADTSVLISTLPISNIQRITPMILL